MAGIGHRFTLLDQKYGRSEPLMAVTREQFESGMTYAAYKAQMTRNGEQFEQNEKDLQLSAEDAQAFRNLPQRINVLALAEDWCGDVIANLPIVGRIAEASEGKLNLRILLRDQQPGEQVMNEHLNKGQYKSIPTVIFLDEDFKELGVWVERPESVTKVREEKRLALYTEHPEWGDPSKPIAELPEEIRTQVQQGAAAIRNQTKTFANAEVVRELRELVQKSTARQPA
jgi:Thioredoxin